MQLPSDGLYGLLPEAALAQTLANMSFTRCHSVYSTRTLVRVPEPSNQRNRVGVNLGVTLAWSSFIPHDVFAVAKNESLSIPRIEDHATLVPCTSDCAFPGMPCNGHCFFLKVCRGGVWGWDCRVCAGSSSSSVAWVCDMGAGSMMDDERLRTHLEMHCCIKRGSEQTHLESMTQCQGAACDAGRQYFRDLERYCVICNRGFKTKWNLKRHLRKMNHDQPLPELMSMDAVGLEAGLVEDTSPGSWSQAS